MVPHSGSCGTDWYQIAGGHHAEAYQRGAFELGAPTTDVLEVTGRPAEDFETIARRDAALPRNRRTLGNRVRELPREMLAERRQAPDH